jgi:hypothetical protein
LLALIAGLVPSRASSPFCDKPLRRLIADRALEQERLLDRTMVVRRPGRAWAR